MRIIKNKHIIILLLSVVTLLSCRTSKKAKTFNGTDTLECTDYNNKDIETKENKKSKWRLVLYKDGKRVGKKHKKGKSKLFKKKIKQ